MSSFLNAQRQIEAQKAIITESQLKLKNLQHLENTKDLEDQSNYEELTLEHTKNLDSLRAKHKLELANIASSHRVDMQHIVNKNINEVKGFKETIVALNNTIERQQQNATVCPGHQIQKTTPMQRSNIMKLCKNLKKLLPI